MSQEYECDACHRIGSKTFETLVKVESDWLCMRFCRLCFEDLGVEQPEEYRDQLIAEANANNGVLKRG